MLMLLSVVSVVLYFICVTNKKGMLTHSFGQQITTSLFNFILNDPQMQTMDETVISGLRWSAYDRYWQLITVSDEFKRIRDGP